MNFSSLFSPSNGFFHLNAGTQTRTTLDALRLMEQARREEENNPTESFYRSYPRFWALQKKVSQFLGARPEDLFFRSNITAAFNDFIFAVPLAAGSEIMATSWEYGATANIAKQRAAQSGLKFRTLKMPKPGSADLDNYFRKNLSGVGLLLLSHVATGTGEILPIEKISRIAQENGTLVAVDGAHAIGALDLDLQSLEHVDFYGGNFHKWFLGPRGTAFGWVHPKWVRKIPWNFGGWASFEIPGFYQGFGEGSVEAAQRFFPGTIDPTPFWGLEVILPLWEAQSKALRAQQTQGRDLAAKLASEFLRPLAVKDQGPLVSFAIPDSWQVEDPVQLATRIYREAKVQIALPRVQGETVLRLSPGVYASEEEIRGGMQALRQFKL